MLGTCLRKPSQLAYRGVEFRLFDFQLPGLNPLKRILQLSRSGELHRQVLEERGNLRRQYRNIQPQMRVFAFEGVDRALQGQFEIVGPNVGSPYLDALPALVDCESRATVESRKRPQKELRRVDGELAKLQVPLHA